MADAEDRSTGLPSISLLKSASCRTDLVDTMLNIQMTVMKERKDIIKKKHMLISATK